MARRDEFAECEAFMFDLFVEQLDIMSWRRRFDMSHSQPLNFESWALSCEPVAEA